MSCRIVKSVMVESLIFYFHLSHKLRVDYFQFLKPSCITQLFPPKMHIFKSGSGGDLAFTDAGLRVSIRMSGVLIL